MKARKYIKSTVTFLWLTALFICSGVTMAVSAESNPNAPTITLSEEEDAGQFGPFKDSEEQMEEMDKLEPAVTHLKKSVEAHNSMNRLRQYRENQRRYEDMVELHELAIEGLRRSEQCTVNYIGRYFNNPVKLWSGRDMNANPEKHELRSGMSAWAINLFEVAKAAQVSPFNVDDVVNMDISDPDKRAAVSDKLGDKVAGMSGDVVAYENKQEEGTNITNVGDLADNTEKMTELTKTQNFLTNPSKEEEYNNESRKNGLIANDVGAMASLSLAAEPTKWGSRKKPFPVWNDVKIFYDQYLDGKYENMRKYIKEVNIFNEIKNQIRNALLEEQRKLMTKAEAEIMDAANAALYKITGTYDNDLSKAERDYNDDLANNEAKRSSAETDLTNEKNAELAKVKAEIEALLDQLDAAQQSLIEVDSQISSHNETIASLESQVSDLQGQIAAAEGDEKTALEAKLAEVNSSLSTANAEASSLNTQKNDLTNKKAQIQADIEAKKAEMTAIAEKYDIDISNVNEQYKSREQGISAQYASDKSKLTREHEAAIKKIHDSAEQAKKALKTNSTLTINKIVQTTNLVIADAKELAYKNIAATRKFLEDMGEDLYLVENHERVVKAHQALLNSLLGNDAQVLDPAGTLKLEGIVAHVASITTDLKNIVNKSNVKNPLQNLGVTVGSVANKNKTIDVKIFANALKSVNFAADTQYFVGKPQKIKDFRTPRKVLDYNLPPVRELVRIDDVDLDNITENLGMISYTTKQKVTAGGFQIPVSVPVSKVDKTRFFTFAARTPEIWQLMLNYKSKAFVETEFDIEKGLSQGSETSNLYRGGIFPCTLGGAKDVSWDERFVTEKYDDEYHNKKGITAMEQRVGVGSTAGNLPQSLISCMEFTRSDPLRGSEKYDDGRYSELGTILGYTKNTLCVNPSAQVVRNYLSRMKAATENGRTIELDANGRVNDLIMKRALYSQNQIGDFLGRVETEQKYAKAVAELEKSVEEMKEDLYSQLKEIGFEPSESFNIGKDSDYELAFTSLDKIKQEHLKDAKKLVDSIKDSGSELLKDSKENYTSLHNALAKDSKAVTQMSMTSQDDEELEEAIKTGEANNSVSDEYQKKADEAMEEQKKLLDKPYCAAY